MLLKIPIDVGKVKSEDLDREILRVAIIGELDAINLYEELANMTESCDIQQFSWTWLKKKKTHVGEIPSHAFKKR